MTQPRVPLFETGVPQIVPTTELEILDLRNDRQQSTSRLITLWVNYSAAYPEVGVRENVHVWVQEGSDAPKRITTASVEQTSGPLKLLENFVLRGNVRLYLSADSVDLVNGMFIVAWGYYSLAGAAPRTAFERRPLQPNPSVIPENMGIPIIFGYPPVLGVSTDTQVLHTVSDTQYDEIRIEANVLSIADPVTTYRFALYFGDTPIVAPFALGPGFISLTSPGQAPSGVTTQASLYRRYFDDIPFIGAGELKVSAIYALVSVPITVTGSFNRV